MRVDSSSSTSVEISEQEPQATESVSAKDFKSETKSEPQHHADSVEVYRSAHDNAWVQSQRDAKQVYEGVGVHALERADEHGRQADNALDDAKSAANNDLKNGQYMHAMTSMTAGFARYAGHTAAQVGNTVVGAGASVGAGIEDVAMGDKHAVQKVAVGGAAIAALATGNPMVGVKAYEAINGIGQMARAESGGEFAVGALKAGLALGGEKVLEKAAAPLAKALVESAPVASRAASEAIQATFGLPAEKLAEHAMSHALAALDGKLIEHIAEKTLMPGQHE